MPRQPRPLSSGILGFQGRISLGRSVTRVAGFLPASRVDRCVMPTDPVKADRKPGDDAAAASKGPGEEPGERQRAPRGGWRGRWRRWRSWLPFVVKPLRRGVILLLLVLVIEYLVVPELVGASKDLHLLGQVN